MLHVPFQFLAGATYPFRALFLLLHKPQLRGYVLIPILINLGVAITLYIGLLMPSLQQVDQVAAHLSGQLTVWLATLPVWLSFLAGLATVIDWLLSTLLAIALFLLTGLLVVQFGVFLGLPWYGQLSEQIEKNTTGSLPPAAAHPLAIAQDLGRSLLFELKKLALTLSIGLFLLLANFIPVIGTGIFSLGSLALAATLIGLDFLDAPLERRKLRFRDKLGILIRNLPATASFSLVCLGLVSLPFINLIAIPVCVAAGTLFFGDRLWSQMPDHPSPS